MINLDSLALNKRKLKGAVQLLKDGYTLNNFNFGFDWTNQKDNTSVRLGEPFSVLLLFDRNIENVFWLFRHPMSGNHCLKPKPVHFIPYSCSDLYDLYLYL